LVLLVVGAASEGYVGRHKRLDDFDLIDLHLLRTFIEPPKRIVVTPNVLSEASNLIGQIGEPARRHIFHAFRGVIGVAVESYVPSALAADVPSFVRLGLADAACLIAEPAAATLLTADLQLYLEATRQGRAVVHFRHLRDYD
jgi:hypothetical protein